MENARQIEADLIASGEALRDFCEEVNRALERRLMARSLSTSRIKTMLFIEHHGSVRSIDMVQAMGYAPRTITEAIDALERDGLVLRSPDKVDRRAKNVTLTEEGTAVLSAAKPTLLEFADQMFSVLNGEERTQLTGLLQRLNGRLKQMEG